MGKKKVKKLHISQFHHGNGEYASDVFMIKNINSYKLRIGPYFLDIPVIDILKSLKPYSPNVINNLAETEDIVHRMFSPIDNLGRTRFFCTYHVRKVIMTNRISENTVNRSKINAILSMLNSNGKSTLHLGNMVLFYDDFAVSDKLIPRIRKVHCEHSFSEYMTLPLLSLRMPEIDVLKLEKCYILIDIHHNLYLFLLSSRIHALNLVFKPV